MSEPGAPQLLTRTQLAGAFAVHPLTITTWGEQGMPTAERGTRGRASRYALPAVVQWYISRELEARGIPTGARLDPLHERALLDKRRREAIEFATAIKQGEYVKARAVELRWTSRIVIARDYLRGLPSRFKLRIPNLTSSDLGIIAEEIVHALNELADQPAHHDDEAPEETYATNGNGHGPVPRRGSAHPDALAGSVPATAR